MSTLLQDTAPYTKVAAPCPYFGTCGGCALQDLAYEDQVAVKQTRIRKALADVPGLPEITVEPAPEPWRYRNKAEFTFGEADGALVLGYHAAGSYWKVVGLEDCLLMPERAMAVVRDVRCLAAESGRGAYHARHHHGFFRYLLVRQSRETGRVLICLITASDRGAADPSDASGRAVIDAMAVALTRCHPALASVYWGTTDRLADVARPETLIRVSGEALLEDRIGPFALSLHPLSFLQPMSQQADRLYARLSELLRPEPSRVAWDLYCGLGLIAFYLSRKARRVYAIDTEAANVELGRANAARNGITNVEFRMGPVEDVLADRRFWLGEGRADLVAVDPPRAGLHQRAVASLLAARPRRIAYLSCNVRSLAQDLRLLLSGFPRYRVAAVEAFDMFPQTNHAEVLAVLERTGEGAGPGTRSPAAGACR